MPSGSARYQSYPSHLPRTSVPPEAYTAAMDSNAAKEQSRDGVKSRGGLPKHMQDQHMSKSEPKLSSPIPGGLYPGSYPPSSGRSQHLLPPQSETPPARGESGTSSREKSQNKPMSIQEQALGKMTITALTTIITSIVRHISCETPDVTIQPSPDPPSLSATSHCRVGALLLCSYLFYFPLKTNVTPRLDLTIWGELFRKRF